MKKIIYYVMPLVLLLSLNNCGYKAIYTSQNTNIKIVKYYIKGNDELSKKLYSKLNEILVLDETRVIKEVTAEIYAVKDKSIMTKDSSGNASSYKITINADLIIIDITSNETLFDGSINTSEMYKVLSQGYQTEKLEEKVISNLIERSAQEFLLRISQSE